MPAKLAGGDQAGMAMRAGGLGSATIPRPANGAHHPVRMNWADELGG